MRCRFVFFSSSFVAGKFEQAFFFFARISPFSVAVLFEQKPLPRGVGQGREEGRVKRLLGDGYVVAVFEEFRYYEVKLRSLGLLKSHC